MSEDVAAIRARAADLARTSEEFKADLVALRERHGLTQAQVGERLGISQEAVSKFEAHDSNPTLASIRRYALAIGARLRLDVVDDTTTTPAAVGHWSSTRLRRWRYSAADRGVDAQLAPATWDPEVEVLGVV